MPAYVLASIGDFTIPDGATELTVRDATVTADSLVVASPIDVHGLISIYITPGDGAFMVGTLSVSYGTPFRYGVFNQL